MNECRHARPMLVVLTGGVASGKTAVSDRLAELGVPVIDTDLIARQVVAPGSPGLDRVVEAFGRNVLSDGQQLDRQLLGELVFRDEAARQRLESILHPLIEADARHQIAAQADADYVVLVVPLLVETGLFEDADRVVVVDLPEARQIERLMQREQIDAAQARLRLDAQASRSQRLAAATDVIDNSGELFELDDQVRRLHARLLKLAAR